MKRTPLTTFVLLAVIAFIMIFATTCSGLA